MNYGLQEADVNPIQDYVNQFFGGATPENPIKLPISAIQVELSPRGRNQLLMGIGIISATLLLTRVLKPK